MLLRRLRRCTPEERVILLRRVGLWTLIGGLLLLALNGRLHWLYALVAALIPLAQRLVPLLRYLPLLRPLYNRYRGQGRDRGPPPPRPNPAQMPLREAYAVLGLQPGASHAEIKAAHRKLMQQHHPDRGGSDWIAQQLNAARDRLLSEYP